MKLKKAIKILKKHQAWRMGSEIPMLPPIEITKAINKIIKKYDKFYSPIPQG
jgi:methyl coenzyme M reductase subunit C-like uncharacterized protein (methanogenesis marker protein 7)